MDGKVTYDLRVPDVAKRYGRSPTWPREMAARGDIPHRRVGRILEFSSEELDLWDEANTVRLEDMQGASA